MSEHATALEGADALVVYASTHGHTAKIAPRVAPAMQSRGLDVDLLEVSTAAGTDPSDYDLVVVAASLHKERHQSEIVDWVKAHRDVLERRPTAFVSVSLSAAEDSDEA